MTFMDEQNSKKNALALPLSIVITGVLIAGAVIYRPSVPQADVVKPVTPKLDYVALAGTLGLDTKAFKTCVDTKATEAEIQKDRQAGVNAGVTGTPTTFVNNAVIAGAQPYSVYKSAIDAALADKNPKPGPGIDDDAVLGDAQAPVTVVVFGDYQCPFCKQAFDTAEKQLRDEYVKTGKVKMVFRDFPLTDIHPAALPAAIAAECVHLQGKYWEYHDALYQNQNSLP